MIAVAAATALLAGSAVGAPRPAAPPQGTRTATVNLPRLIDKLQERQEFEMQIAAMRNQYLEEANARKKKLESGLKEIEAMADTPERQERLEPLLLEQLELENWANSRMADIDRERSLMWRSIYRNLRSEAAKLAEAEGYDLIILDDGSDDLPTNREIKMPLEQQVLEQFQRRRVLFASPAHDMTDKLIVRMNNARAAIAPPTPK
jgi:Skp family chaperone for outer membrane proteins